MINDKGITALICECNPFHEGHKRIINKAKENGTLLVCIMSPDFVQRGEPAVFDKYKRTENLLNNGADLVVELPVEYALSSAKYFAKAAIYIVNKLGFIDNIIFGSFINDLKKLQSLSNITYMVQDEFDIVKNNNRNTKKKLITEQILNDKNLQYNIDLYNKKIKENLKKGYTYPKALSISLGLDIKSNDILNIEYLNALKELQSKINPITFERKRDMKGASDIRKTMTNILTIDNFTEYLNQILFYNNKNGIGYIDYYGIDESFNNSLINISHKNMSFSERVDKLATKNRTFANVKRNLLHILLDIKKKDMNNKKYFSNYNYVRILGFNKNGSSLIKRINMPYLLGYTKKELDRFDTAYYNHNKNRSILINIYASDLYQFVSKNEIYETNRKVVKI